MQPDGGQYQEQSTNRKDSLAARVRKFGKYEIDNFDKEHRAKVPDVHYDLTHADGPKTPSQSPENDLPIAKFKGVFSEHIGNGRGGRM